MFITLITSGKRKQIVRLMEDGLDDVELDDGRAQRLISSTVMISGLTALATSTLRMRMAFSPRSCTSSSSMAGSSSARGLCPVPAVSLARLPLLSYSHWTLVP